MKKDNQEFQAFKENARVEANKTGLNGVYKRFYEAVQSDRFVSFESLINTAFLDANLVFDAKILENLKEIIKQGIKSKKDLVTSSFVVAFAKQPSFSLIKTYPTLKSSESPTTDSISLKNSNNDQNLNTLLTAFDALIHELVLVQNKFVEVVEEIIVYQQKDTGALKLVFSENVFN
ncbi:DUF2714 domain-containing protein [Ureaplasma sp. ES3154-GEN]|uniref:DUF2714 domain-containing protein n=1 Tax=Ureaplasma sp. ES3154-GEN TaxID=2984844 RepID=UPI0021E9991C|nr:DUF2714 domain-containing protein [Ureaplasma sp. ES3154-GEN]MCV3743322.1 DUF2714 domain-containing protein [Ureaplasma sp. ES3154-GEN]